MEIETNYKSIEDSHDKGIGIESIYIYEYDNSNDNGNAISLIEYIDKKDKEYSNIIFAFEGNKFIEISLYVFARLFNPDLVFLYFIIMIIYFGFFKQSLTVVLKSLAHVLVTLIISSLLKHFFKRNRPNIDVSFSKTRFTNLRKKELNCSMPSGDSMQSANFSIIILFYFKSYCGFLFIPLVMMGRIYYHCHYILDTVVGTVIGLIVSYGTYVLIN